MKKNGEPFEGSPKDSARPEYQQNHNCAIPRRISSPKFRFPFWMHSPRNRKRHPATFICDPTARARGRRR